MLRLDELLMLLLDGSELDGHDWELLDREDELDDELEDELEQQHLPTPSRNRLAMLRALQADDPPFLFVGVVDDGRF
jgi:hypothetical protein